MRTRFAPSPTGDLHWGGAWTALASWVVARRAGGASVLRIEDIDRPRVVGESQSRIEEDLRWLGLNWDEGPFLQSARYALYKRALARLNETGLVYPCDCSRAEIARVASAPHPGQESVYPGLCRDRDPSRPMKRPPALRIRVPGHAVEFCDGAFGRVSQDLSRDVGDFVLVRGDGVFAYHLAVVVDDLDMRVTDVVRGADLVHSTPRQIWLASLLGGSPPAYTHVAVVLSEDGARLEKRAGGATIRALRAAGASPEGVVGVLAHGLGLRGSDAPTTAADLARESASRSIRWRTAPWRAPGTW